MSIDTPVHSSAPAFAVLSTGIAISNATGSCRRPSLERTYRFFVAGDCDPVGAAPGLGQLLANLKKLCPRPARHADAAGLRPPDPTAASGRGEHRDDRFPRRPADLQAVQGDIPKAQRHVPVCNLTLSA